MKTMNEPKKDEKLMNIKEAAEFLGVSTVTLWRNGKEIGCYRIGNRRLFSLEKHIIPFLEKKETTLVAKAA